MSLITKLTAAFDAHNAAPRKATLREFYNVCREANKTLGISELREFVAHKATLTPKLIKV